MQYITLEFNDCRTSAVKLGEFPPSDSDGGQVMEGLCCISQDKDTNTPTEKIPFFVKFRVLMFHT